MEIRINENGSDQRPSLNKYRIDRSRPNLPRCQINTLAKNFMIATTYELRVISDNVPSGIPRIGIDAVNIKSRVL